MDSEEKGVEKPEGRVVTDYFERYYYLYSVQT